MKFFHGQIRVAYLYKIGELINWIVTSCAMPHGDISGCMTGTTVLRSDMRILGSEHVWLYPFDIFITHPHRALVNCLHAYTMIVQPQ